MGAFRASHLVVCMLTIGLVFVGTAHSQSTGAPGDSSAPDPQTSAPTPAPTTSAPTTTTSAPTPTTSAPTSTTPTPETSAPTPTTSAPTPTTSAPTPTTSAPTPTTSAPTATTSAPTATTSAPTPTTSTPTPTTLAPSSTPTTSAPTPTTSAPTSTTSAPTPTLTTSAPTPTLTTSAPTPTPTSAPPPPPTPIQYVAGPPSYLAINCGGLTPANASIPQYYGGVTYGYGNSTFYQPNNTYVSTQPAGKGDIVFQSDRFYFGTSTKPKEYLGFAPPSGADGALYLTERYGLSFMYELDLPNGAYNVDLYFAELQFNQAGARVFSVSIQGVKVEPNLDIYAQVGANKSLIITKPATVSNGLLSILFETVSSNVNDGEAKVNAIRVYTNSNTNVAFPAPPTSYFVDAGSSASYIAADGVNYTRDSYFSGGSAVAFTAAGASAPLLVNRTTDPIVYSTVRVGPSFSYYFNLPVGHYWVDLEFVEGQFTLPGQRLFTVEIQGVQAFPVIDIIANSSYALSPAPAPAASNSSLRYTPSSFNLTTAASVSNGLLRIDFNGTRGNNATVSAIKVTPLRSNTNATIAIDCGSPIDVVSGNGVIFQKDTNYSAASYPAETNPYQVFLPYNDGIDDFLYPTIRQGNFTYNFSLPNGTYLVTLFFADLNATGPGQRIFDVYIQEVKVLSHLDVFNQTGGAITVLITQFPANVTARFLSIRLQTSPDALSLPNIQRVSYTLNGTNYNNALYPPFLSALFVQPGIPLPTVAPAPAPAIYAPGPIGPPPPPGAPDPYFTYVYTPADAPEGPVPPVPTYGGAAAVNPSCPANGAPPQAINCTGPCPAWSPNFALNVAVNAAGPRYVSSCGIVFEDDSSNATRCGPGDVIPTGARWCRTNIKGPDGGYQYSTAEGIFDTSDPTLFQTEFIGFNTYKFRLPSPGIYQVYSYFAEIAGTDPIIDVNRPGLRIFYIHFNGNAADAIGPIDPFALAGNRKYTADPTIGRGVQCTSNELSVQFEPSATGRDAPAVKGLWVFGPVDSNFNPLAPLGSQAPTGVIAPPPPVGTPPSPVGTTPPPVATTASPVATTASPVATTASPVATTASPVATTPSPVATTASPVATTASPVATTASPVATTASPVATTPAPVATTPPPVSTPASSTSNAPVTSTNAPTPNGS